VPWTELDPYLTFDNDLQEEMEELVPDQLQDLGYGAHNSIMNMNTMAVVLAWLLLKVSYLIILTVIVNVAWCLRLSHTKFYINFKKWRDKLLNSDLLINTFLTFYLEAYPDVMISNMLSLDYLKRVGLKVAFSRSGEAISMIMTFLSLFFQVVILPITSITIIILGSKKLGKDQFKDRIGDLYGDVHLEHEGKCANDVEEADLECLSEKNEEPKEEQKEGGNKE